jgi:hypothetical protein
MPQTSDEKTYVEIPFIEQLKGVGWDHIEGDIDVPYLTERENSLWDRKKRLFNIS